MNALARYLALYLLVVFLDAALGFGAYKAWVRGGAAAYCFVTNQNSRWNRRACTNAVFYSSTLWRVISLLMGAAAGYVTLQAVSTGRW